MPVSQRRPLLGRLLAAVPPLVALPALVAAPWLNAQNRPIQLAVGVSRVWVGSIYRGRLQLVGPFGVANYSDGTVALEAFTTVNVDLELQPHAWPFGLYAKTSLGNAPFRADGRGVDGSSAGSWVADADIFTLAVGASKPIQLGTGLPAVNFAFGTAVLQVRAPADRLFYGPRVREFLSPGFEGSVGVQYPGRATRVSLELRPTLSVLRHDTEGLDGGFRPPDDSGPLARWGASGSIGVAGRLALRVR